MDRPRSAGMQDQKTEHFEKKVHFRALMFIFQDFKSTFDILLEKAGSTTLHLSRLFSNWSS